MRSFKTVASLLIASAVLLAVGYFVVVWLSARFAVLNPNVAAAILAAMIAAMAAILGQRQARRRDVEEGHRQQKIQVYDGYMDIIDYLFAPANKAAVSKISEGTVAPDLEKMLRKLRRGLIVWASPDVITSFEAFFGAANRGDKEGYRLLELADNVFRAMRKDLGNSNWGLGPGALLKLFLKDPTEYDRALGHGK